MIGGDRDRRHLTSLGVLERLRLRDNALVPGIPRDDAVIPPAQPR